MSTLKFRVLLDSETDNEVFRDIIISESASVESLYNAIIQSFNFQGDQMASFYLSNEEWDKGQEISLMDMSYGDEEPEEKPLMMSSTLLENVIEDVNQKLILVYDFMRMWIFLVELIEKTNEVTKESKVVLSVGMAPPEDSKMMQLDEDEDTDFDFDDEDEMFGSDFEDGYDEEDYSSYNDY